MAELTELQVAFVIEEIRLRGVRLHGLQEDLTDHICTAIESRIDSGESFETAFHNTMKLFGPGGLMQVQEQTLFLLTQMNETMKKLTTGFGLATVALLLAGIFFKIMHWPGAGVMLVSGNALLVLFYLPPILIHKLRESPREEHLMLILGFVGLGLFAMGTTFRVMHWPMGNPLFWTGFATLALGFTPAYFYNRYKNSVNKSITITTALVVLMGIIQIGQLINLHPSRQYYFGMGVINEVIRQNAQQAGANDLLLRSLAEDERAGRLSAEADVLLKHMEDLKTFLISETEGISLTEAGAATLTGLRKADNHTVPTHILIGDYDHPRTDAHSARYLAGKLKEFRATVLGTYDESMRTMIDPMLGLHTEGEYRNVKGETEDWARYHFYHVTLMAAVTHLTKLQWEVRQAENQALIYLKSQSETPGPPSPES